MTNIKLKDYININHTKRVTTMSTAELYEATDPWSSDPLRSEKKIQPTPESLLVWAACQDWEAYKDSHGTSLLSPDEVKERAKEAYRRSGFCVWLVRKVLEFCRETTPIEIMEVLDILESKAFNMPKKINGLENLFYDDGGKYWEASWNYWRLWEDESNFEYMQNLMRKELHDYCGDGSVFNLVGIDPKNDPFLESDESKYEISKWTLWRTICNICESIQHEFWESFPEFPRPIHERIKIEK